MDSFLAGKGLAHCHAKVGLPVLTHWLGQILSFTVLFGRGGKVFGVRIYTPIFIARQCPSLRSASSRQREGLWFLARLKVGEMRKLLFELFH